MKRGPKPIAYYIWITFIWVCLIESTGVNCRSLQSYSPLDDELPPKLIDTVFKLPAPIPTWSSGTDFGSGIIDIGSLQVMQISTFDKVWTVYGGGDRNMGASFFEPASIPEGFHMLGSYCQPNSQPLYGWVLVAKDDTLPGEKPALVPPTDYSIVWTSELEKNITQESAGYIWFPVAPLGYKTMGFVVTNSSQKPPLDKVRVVRSLFTEPIELESLIWGWNGFDVYNTRPQKRGVYNLGVPVGTFLATVDILSLSCFTNENVSFPSMPDINQTNTLIQAYAPVVYLHPDEEYFPSSVSWFFQNGAMLYSRNVSVPPITIAPDGQNLPRGGSNDHSYWIDLPSDDTAAENLMKGSLKSATAYVHIKPALGGTFTDIVVWLFYPFNGPGKVGIGSLSISLAPAGEHVGDWEHLALRISNFNGELKSVYFSEHSKGTWLSSSLLEFESNNKPVVYSSRFGHALYANAGVFIHTLAQEKVAVGARNDTSKSEFKMDTGANFTILDSEFWERHLNIVSPPWLDYAREWGPSKSFSLGKLVANIEISLPQPLRYLFDKLMRLIPKEALYQEGPIGPKWKDNWAFDERY